MTKYRWVLLVVLTVTLVSPFVLFIGYGLSQGNYVMAGLQNLLWDPAREAQSQPAYETQPAQVSWVADINDYEIAESSGLAASNLHPGILWTINDSGSDPIIYAMNLDGDTVARVQIETTSNVDWESLDSFQLAGRSYLAIGDTGDNFRWRPYVDVIVVPEPASLTNHATQVAWQVRYTYPSGPKDSEAMAVDAHAGRILLLSKREYPPRLFELPLQPQDVAEVHQAKPLGEITLPQPTEVDLERDATAQYRHMPSGMDLAIRKDSSRVLLITTYQHAYLLPLAEQTDNGQLGELSQVRLPTLGQREAIAFAFNSATVAYMTKERREQTGMADIFSVELK